MKRVYVAGQASEKLGYGISHHGSGFFDDLGRDITKGAKRFGKLIHKGVTSKPFKDVVKFARTNIITPLAKKGVEFGSENLGNLIKMIPGVGIPASIAYDAFGKPIAKKIGTAGVDYLDKQAQKHGYGIKPHGFGIRPHGGSNEQDVKNGNGITPHGGSMVPEKMHSKSKIAKTQSKHRTKAIESLVDSMLTM